MKTKYFKTGILILLPSIVFVWLLVKIKNMIFGVSDNILSVFPKENLPDNTLALEILIIIGISLAIYFIGYIYSHYYIGKRLTSISKKIISKIPVLSVFYRVARQIEETLSKKNSFKEVVLVEFPVPGVYSIGFITGENTRYFEEVLEGSLVSVFIPTTPNPTNGFLSLVEKNKIVRTKISVSNAIEYIISMGTVNIGLNTDLNN